MKLDELLDPGELQEALTSGMVRLRMHPRLPLGILNYTEAAQYSGTWNHITRTCRGLIYNIETGEIIARPWPKFFNYGQPEAGELDLHAEVEVTDKVDGSLGILYLTPEGPAVATRGSFTSEQALHATDVLRTRYRDAHLPAGTTVLVEIVYPENRIVLDYGAMDDLVLLGGVVIHDGYTAGPAALAALMDWNGPRVDVMAHGSLAEALAAPPRRNAEGLVVRYRATGQMVKIKQDDYVQLHRAVTGLNERAVWEMLGDGKTVKQICTALPDELHRWVCDVALTLSARALDLACAAIREHRAILKSLGGVDAPGFSRKAYAAAASLSDLRPWLFMLLDGKDPAPSIWKTLRPSTSNRPFGAQEEQDA